MSKLRIFLIRFLPSFYTARIQLNLITSRRSETAVRRCFTKQVFLKIFQNSQGNTYVGVTFNKLQRLKRLTTAFLCYFQEHLFSNHPSKSNIFTKKFSEFSCHFSQRPNVVFWTQLHQFKFKACCFRKFVFIL